MYIFAYIVFDGRFVQKYRQAINYHSKWKNITKQRCTATNQAQSRSKIQALLEFQLFCKFNYGFIAFLFRLCYAENRKQRAAQQCVFVRGIYIHYKSNSFIRHIQRRNNHDRQNHYRTENSGAEKEQRTHTG